MTTVAIIEFNAHYLQLFSLVARTKEPVVVTKLGKPLVEVIPFQHSDESPVPGKLSETLVFEKDIVSPLGELT
jgi:antitoxin (DNA-binding transcriptional repressor) of toxin-antitoxin stability system